MRGVHADASDEVAQLYAAACPRLIGLLTVVGGSRADAEEVAQEAFVKLLQRWSTVREYDDPEMWLRTVAVRMLVSRHRRHRVARLALPRLAGPDLEHADPGGTDDLIDLASAIARLPIDQRAVLVLHHLVDRPVDEVARVLKVPVGTVKSRLARARAALAPHLVDSEQLS
ncbi:sigma-70 family RNA polymerase sigma factor [Nocardioides antri]|uniref:sigma-70 family RNA polymerase sigma factor n=1 Tax=Nocardioides antri TaxID=2607659 RepID=UPI00165FB82E|nr:sigma-70 family RNA polymerase sigma factor [Nocardioides antri]